ncbi:PCRF domain-containing protein [Patescibacteria group bacterium]|nr:PCRF domain-containing protein [Patescibacteria group bacterium]
MNNCIIEIRSAAGGDEAKIWADDLVRMYSRFGQKNGWEVKSHTSNSIQIKGAGAYEAVRHEAGVHRVQRIPQTERYGRIHTSTATVTVLPLIPATELKINPNDLDWQFYRASSQGGQNVQKVNTAVRVIHKPTNTVVTCQTERYQEQNRKIALELLRAMLWEKKQSSENKKVDDIRRKAVGRGERAEKIRTYNYPQNRVTDHRIKKSWHNLDDILDGNLKKIFKDLGAQLG